MTGKYGEHWCFVIESNGRFGVLRDADKYPLAVAHCEREMEPLNRARACVNAMRGLNPRKVASLVNRLIHEGDAEALECVEPEVEK